MYSVDTISLRKKMLDAGVPSIAALSDGSGISKPTIGCILNGKGNPSYQVMVTLINYLSISPREAGEIFFAKDLHDTQDK